MCVFVPPTKVAKGKGMETIFTLNIQRQCVVSWYGGGMEGESDLSQV